MEQNILYKIIIFKNIEKAPEVEENSTDYGKKKFEELSFTIEVKMQIPFFLDKCQFFLKE